LVHGVSAPEVPGESIEARKRRKTTKWMRVQAADEDTRLVHLSDVVDNLISLRFVSSRDPAATKVPRWLMQARDYQLPIARATSHVFAKVIEDELDYELRRGRKLGNWSSE
jgi:hypothetical protein